MRLSFPGLSLALVLLLSSLPLAAVHAANDGEATETSENDKEPLVIEEGRTVSIEYTLKLDDGSTADTNVGEDPLVYEQGAQQMLPAFEREVAGMEVDQTREFSLGPKEGYGPVRPDLRKEVEAEMVPEEARREGAQLVSQDPEGNRHLVRVHEVRDDETLVLDLNHPLAGEKLHFEVKVVGIE